MATSPKPITPSLRRTSLTNGLVVALPFAERGSLVSRNMAPGLPRVTQNATGAPTWSANARGPALRFNNTTDTLPIAIDSVFMPTGNITIVIGWKKTDATLRASVAFGDNIADATTQCRLSLPYSDGNVYFAYGTGVDFSASGLTFGDDIWAATVGPRGSEIWQNGKLVGFSASIGTRSNWTSVNFRINGDGNFGGDLAECSCFHVWSRQLTVGEIKAQARDPFALYAAPKRRRSVRGATASGPTVTPTTASLTLATFAPTVTTPRLCTPTTAALTLTTFAPILGNGYVPTTAALTLTTFAPTVSTPSVCTPTTAALTLTPLSPTVTTALSTATGQNTETDAALAATVTAAAAITTGQTAETDSALAATVAAAFVAATGQATETDEALPLLQAQAVECGRAEETDEALGCDVQQTGGSSGGGSWYIPATRQRRERPRPEELPRRPERRRASLAAPLALALLLVEMDDSGL